MKVIDKEIICDSQEHCSEQCQLYNDCIREHGIIKDDPSTYRFDRCEAFEEINKEIRSE